MTTVVKDYLIVAQNASGRNLNVPIYRFTGQLPGPKVYIQSSIHGAEVQGNVVIHQLIEILKNTEIKGQIILAPNCNPVGTNIKSGEYTLGRFDPINGQNWNRGYYYQPELIKDFVDTLHADSSLESIKRAYRQTIKTAVQRTLDQDWGTSLAQTLNLKLQLNALDADIVLDLHNGPVSTRHIYVPEYAKSSAHYFNSPQIILIPNQFAGALDEATFCYWWTLTELLQERFPHRQWHFDVEAFTMEMGSQEVIDFDAGYQDALSILSYLNYKGCLENCDYSPKAMSRFSAHLKDYKIMYSPKGGIVEYIAKPGEHIKQGQLMAKILNVDELDNHQAVTHILAPCDLIPLLHFPSASVLGGTQLYKCLTNYKSL
jgi:predicted deacylase